MSPRKVKQKNKGKRVDTPDDERDITTSNKPYRCPGCDQIIPMATPHTVAWLEHDQSGRRHWHNICWSKRNLRKPKVERTRNAPRY